MRRQPPRTMRGVFTTSGGWTRVLPLLAAGVCLIAGTTRLLAADEDGIALALIYDTSGSMREPVRTAEGKLAAKYVIGNRALEQIVRRLQHFATNSTPPRTVHAG